MHVEVRIWRHDSVAGLSCIRGRGLGSLAVSKLEAPFVERTYPPPSRMPSLIYLATTTCLHCESRLEDDPTDGPTETWVGRRCLDCGTRFYSNPPDEPAMRTRELMTYRGDWNANYNDSEADRRRGYLLANLSRRLNGLVEADDQARGYGFQDAMAKLFRIEGMSFEPGYRRHETQVDGAVEVDGWYYLLELRWRRKPASLLDLTALRDKVKRSSRQTMGLFVSMSGWTLGAERGLRGEGEQTVILMKRADVAAVLEGSARLPDLMRAKARHLALYGEPYLAPAAGPSRQQDPDHDGKNPES